MIAFDRLRRLLRLKRPAPMHIVTAGYEGPDRRNGPRQPLPRGTRVLVVDDSRTIVAVLSRMLGQNGCEVLVARDGREAVSTAREARAELIFLDIVMPTMNGFAALRELRREDDTRDIPVIMMSGNEQATEQFYVQRIGADDFMKKPFSRAEVFARIEGLVSSGRIRIPQEED